MGGSSGLCPPLGAPHVRGLCCMQVVAMPGAQQVVEDSCGVLPLLHLES